MYHLRGKAGRGVFGGKKRIGERRRERADVHSAQLGESFMVDVICLFSALRVGLLDVSRRMTSWRLEGGRVNMRGMGEDDMVGASSVRMWLR